MNSTETQSSPYLTARRAGAKKYTSERACRRCGGTERYVSSQGCIACQIASAKGRRVRGVRFDV